MNFIKELINSARCGSFAGKGNKATRKGQHEDALDYYRKALELSDNDGTSAVMLHCIARTYARLEDYENALSTAENSLTIYTDLDSSGQVIIDEIKRLTCFVEAFKNKDKKKINELLSLNNQST